MQLLNTLNEEQRQAVTSNAPVIRCLAGAGSGKTRVLTGRIAYLHQEQRVGTSNMLALTFTRLAAKEMKERLTTLVGTQEINKLFCGTFHSFCVQVLREWGHMVGIEPNFTIYDEEDRQALLQAIINDLNAKKVKIGMLLTNMQVWDKVWPDGDLGRVAHEYYYRLRQHNALDLDLLLHRTNDLLDMESVRNYYSNIYKYVFVDEFQDTNSPQTGILIKLQPQSLFVVGDDFQSIYGWRGANVHTIINFGPVAGFPDPETVKLEQNYRSTKNIVEAANQLISNNLYQTEKKLISDRPGAPIICYETYNEQAEENLVADYICENQQDTDRKWSDYAILARTNAKLHKVKAAFDMRQIPCQIVNAGGDVFKKPIVKGILEFISAASNPSDNITVKKAFSFPEPRSTSYQMDKWELAALNNEIPLLDVIENSDEPGAKDFDRLIRDMRQVLDEDGHDVESVFVKSDELLGMYAKLLDKGLLNRWEDVKEARRQIVRWKRVQEEMNGPISYDAFLRWLRTKDIQERLLQEEKDAVKLLTVHAAKGLEFPVVVIAGMNQGVFPSKRAEDMEEERRLFYVAITRAKDQLVITRANERVVWGNHVEATEPSQFLSEAGFSKEATLND